MTEPTDAQGATARRKRYVPVVGPKLGRLLAVVLGLFALLVVDSAYLVSITLAGEKYQDWFYLVMFLAHLVLGLVLVVPLIVFGSVHAVKAWDRPNRRAVRVGVGLLTTAVLLVISGFVLMRVDVGGVRL